METRERKRVTDMSPQELAEQRERQREALRIMVERAEQEMETLAEAFAQGWLRRGLADDVGRSGPNRAELFGYLESVAEKEDGILEMLPYREAKRIISAIAAKHTEA